MFVSFIHFNKCHVLSHALYFGAYCKFLGTTTSVHNAYKMWVIEKVFGSTLVHPKLVQDLFANTGGTEAAAGSEAVSWGMLSAEALSMKEVLHYSPFISA